VRGDSNDWKLVLYFEELAPDLSLVGMAASLGSPYVLEGYQVNDMI
jgi:hypothetical protein